MVAVTPAGQLYARLVRTSVSSETVISVLRSFRRKIGTPLLVVWDRLNAHRSKLTGAFLSAGATVVAVDREQAGIEALASRSERVIPVQGDVADTSLPEMVDAALDRASLSLDALINNAGVARGAHAIGTSDEDLQRYFDINILGVFRMSSWGVARMMKTGRGAIVNTASIFGMIGAYNSAGYSMSKAAVIGMTRQMATDFGPSDIRVNAVAPGLIETPLTAERIQTETWRRQIMIEQCPLQRVGKPEDIARGAVPRL